MQKLQLSCYVVVTNVGEIMQTFPFKRGSQESGYRMVDITEKRVGQLIRERIRSSQSLMSIFEDFEVAPERLDQLRFIVTDLKEKYAETDLETMKLNTSLFADGDFFEKHFFVVAHEIVHWLSRVKENDAYFNDPEEVLGFVASVAYEIEQNSDIDIVWNRVYPKISWHFSNESDAREFFENIIEKAKNLL